MAKVKVTNSGELAAARSGVYVEAGETSDVVEVADAELPLLDSHPDLSYELAEDDSSSQENTDSDLVQFDGENVGDSSADSTVDDKLEEEYINQGLSEEQAEAEANNAAGQQGEAGSLDNAMGTDPSANENAESSAGA